MAEKIFWYNGSLIKTGFLELAIDDPGLLYGATVFTTMRVYQSLDSQLTNWREHCDRLQRSLQTFGWQMPDWERLRQGALALIAFFPVLRITIFPDGREWITGRFIPADLTERQKMGIAAKLTDAPEFRRSLPNYKTGNYLPAWMALSQAHLAGAKEAILVDAFGNWLETSTGNIWGWQEGRWWTPPKEAGILAGVVRSQLISWLRYHYQPVGEAPWDASFVKRLEAIAYTNSVVEVIPIRAVLNQQSTITYDPFHYGLEQLSSLFRR